MQSPVLLALAVAGVASAAVNGSARCHCQPSQPCWPSPEAWNHLNASLSGRLIALRPIASVCHDPDYDAAACAQLQANSNNSAYLATQSGALQWENWASWPARGQECYAETARGIPCGQGRIPLYSAQVESVEDIQTTVRFAAANNIKLTIRNTGHSFLGQSSAPNSLQIDTHRLDSISIDDSWTPQLPPGTQGPPPAGVPAATFGAGVVMHQAYTALNKAGRIIAGGSSSTVGVAGGFLQGGGHGILGHIAGMGSDNALEFTVVTANGSVVTANEYQNQDLFWALRGGGGGSWGVVVNATVKTYPDYPVTAASISFTTAQPSAAFWAGVEASNAHLVPLNDQGATGYFYITPYAPVSANTTVSTFNLYLFFVNQTDVGFVNRTLAPMLAAMLNAAGTAPAVDVGVVPTMTSLMLSIFPGADDDGALVLLGSRLLSRSFVSSSIGPGKLAQTFSRLRLGPSEYIQGLLVAGGQVAANAGVVDSALNPAWRTAALHLIFIRLWTADMPLATQTVLAEQITHVQMPLLEALEPGPMAAYANEANAYQPNFQQVFWGDNYPRLYAIKQAVDPANLFISRLGVGSEDWDDDGACRV